MGSPISLPALHVNPPQDPSEGFQRLLAMKGMLQQQAGQQQVQQQRAIDIQNAQMQQQDQIKLRTLFIKHQGDLDKVIQDAPQSGVSPQTIQQLQLHNVDVKTKTADLVQKQGANAATQADLMQGAHDAVANAAPENKAAEYQKQLQGLAARNIDVSQMPPQYPGDEQFQMLGAVVKGHKQLVDDAVKQAEAAKNTNQAGEAAANQKKAEAALPGVVAEGQIKQAEAASMSEGGMTPAMADSRYRVVSQRKLLGQPVSPADNAFLKTYEKQKTLNAVTVNAINNAVPKDGSGQPSAIAKGIADGSIKWNDVVSPRTPMAVKDALLKEVKGINPNFKSSDFDVEKKVQEAFTSGNYSQQLNSINRAREHMQTFLDKAKDLDGGDVQAFNAIGNALSVQFGSDKVGNLQIAKQAFSSEVGKAFAGSSVGVTDREELNKAIKNASSFQQLAGAAKTADTLLEGAQKALKQTYESGKQGKPNFGGGDTSGQIVVNDPKGGKHYFKNQADADTFKKLANIP